MDSVSDDSRPSKTGGDRLSIDQDVAELIDPILVVAVTHTYPKLDAYQAARFAWPVGVEKVKSVKYVLATKDRTIVGVFAPAEWKRATRENFPEFARDRPNRLGFVGKEADDAAKKRYLGKRLPPEFKFAGTGMRYAGTLEARPISAPSR